MFPLLFLSLSQSLYVFISVYISPSLFNLCLLPASTSLSSVCVCFSLSLSLCVSLLSASPLSLSAVFCLSFSPRCLSHLCVSVYVSLYISLFMSLSAMSFCFTVALSVSLCVSLCMCVFVCVSLHVSFSGCCFSVCLSVGECGTEGVLGYPDFSGNQAT